MKFPLSESPFPPLELQPEQVAHFEQLAQQQLDHILREYSRYSNDLEGTVDTQHWQRVKNPTNASLALYQSNSAFSPKAPSSSSSPFFPSPTLLGVGTVAGGFDDIMFGLLARTDDEMALQAAQTESGLLDGRVLAILPTPSKPQGAEGHKVDAFRCHSIKWIASAATKMPVTGTVLRVRDLVVLDCTGTSVLPSGETIGYHLVQSIELTTCGSLEGVTRDSMTSSLLCLQPASVHSQNPSQSQDQDQDQNVMPGTATPVFATLRASTTTKLASSPLSPSSFSFSSNPLAPTTRSATAPAWLLKQLQSYRKLAACGAHKKLSWMLAESNAQRRDLLRSEFPGVGPHTASKGEKERGGGGGGEERSRAGSDFLQACCSQCRTGVGLSSRLTSCEVCLDFVCSKCITHRPLSFLMRYGHSEYELKTMKTCVCVVCVTRSQQLTARQVMAMQARQQRAKADRQLERNGTNTMALEGSQTCSNSAQILAAH